ncbi:hypothetical protein G3567_11990 [Psychroflexus sp. YR1-1]|uniref:Uncharacterized protein n=1 Tax=Psychroflexus aurantiacus TaxID=2709310 RepID=A0A6B3RBH4_9FLAO|nr:hypothetical protein [Psychroflexus aurantiacus]NEV94864.1 hypothetical protein [Psychroflexus aurantiacus]
METLKQITIVIKRNMKNIIYLSIVLIFVQACFAQEGYNSLNDTEYANVKFQGVSFEAIKATDGDVQAMRELFPSSTASNHPDAFKVDEFGSEIGEPQRYFYFNSGLKIFFGLEGPNVPAEIGRLESPDITVLGHHLEVGDSIDVFGDDIEFNQRKNGGYSIRFIKNNGYCCPIVIVFDRYNKITKIVYLIYT